MESYLTVNVIPGTRTVVPGTRRTEQSDNASRVKPVHSEYYSTTVSVCTMCLYASYWSTIVPYFSHVLGL
jgi:hypothetical protein